MYKSVRIHHVPCFTAKPKYREEGYKRSKDAAVQRRSTQPTSTGLSPMHTQDIVALIKVTIARVQRRHAGVVGAPSIAA